MAGTAFIVYSVHISVLQYRPAATLQIHAWDTRATRGVRAGDTQGTHGGHARDTRGTRGTHEGHARDTRGTRRGHACSAIVALKNGTKDASRGRCGLLKCFGSLAQ